MEVFNGEWRNSLLNETDRYSSFIKEKDNGVGSFLSIDPEKGITLSGDGEGNLSGIPFGVKDNIAVESFPLTCGSKILEGLKAPYTATSVKS